MTEREEQEKICTQVAMDQWRRSLKRPDMQEEDRIKGALMAYKRMLFAFEILPKFDDLSVDI